MLPALKLSRINYGFQRAMQNYTLKRPEANNIFLVPTRYISSESIKNQINEISNNLSDIQVNQIVIDPSFQSVNLNNSTPAGLIQWLLENMHINLELPWWGCIASIALLFKLVDLPRIYNINRSIGKIPISSEIDNKPVKVSRVSQLTNYKISDIQPKKEKVGFDHIYQTFNFAYQGVIFVSLFSAMKGIIEADIPSFSSGGLWWFTNLNISDPYFILPIISTGVFVAFIESNRIFTEVRISRLTNILFGIGFCGVLTQFPSSFVLYWVCSNTITFVFASILKIHSIRRILKLPQLVRKPDFEYLERMHDKETEMLDLVSKSFTSSLLDKMKGKSKKS